MRPTLNSLSVSVRSTMSDLLNAHLADCMDLHARAKHSHWNVRGPRFLTLHELFDSVAETADELADEIAERCVQLGGDAHGTVFDSAAASRIPEPRATLADEGAHVRHIAHSLAAFGASARAAIDTASAAGDQATADLFTEVVRKTDKSLWMVESHF